MVARENLARCVVKPMKHSASSSPPTISAMTTRTRRPRRRTPKPVDPRLSTPGWKAIRAYWARQVRDHGPIYCQAPTCKVGRGVPIRIGGTRGPAHLDVGHLTLRTLAPGVGGWGVEDTRPEHARCNRSAGARAGNQLRAQRRKNAPTIRKGMLVVINDF